jgi:uncharacterized protein YwqG
MHLPAVPSSLRRLSGLLQEFSMPSVRFFLDPQQETAPGASKLGGTADLPRDFEWPHWNDTPLDFLLQINLAEAAVHDSSRHLPASGLLSFFYDLKEQPWGFDPKQLEGFRVCYTPVGNSLQPMPVPRKKFLLEQSAIHFEHGLSLPHIGSRAYDQFERLAQMSDEEADSYFDYVWEVEHAGESKGGNHHLMGYSANVQGDMQLEAQLVMNGLYCGNATGYKDPRRKELEAGAEDWILLLQLDSDDEAGFMWGDAGMLYFWIRRQDLSECRFDRAWMGLQCG